MLTLMAIGIIALFIMLVIIVLERFPIGRNDELGAIHNHAPIGIIKFDSNGVIKELSPVAQTILGTENQQVIGKTLGELDWTEHQFEEVVERSKKVKFSGLQDQQFSLEVRKCGSNEHLGFLSDITTKVSADETLLNANIIFDAVTFAQERFIHSKDIDNLSSIFEKILSSVLAVTKSSHGIVAKVEINQKIHIQATTHQSYVQELKNYQSDKKIQDPDFAFLYSVVERVIKDKRAILGDRTQDKKGVAQQSSLNNCYVYPFIYKDEILGVLAIGKEEGDYTFEDTEFILPMLQASIILIEGLRIELERIETEKKLNERDLKLTESLKQLELKNQELAQARDLAQQANKSKSSFLANMSHEIRTPLNAIMGMTELVKHTELTPKQKKFIDIVYSQSDVLLSLINDILDMSKIEAGELKIEAIECNILDVVKNVTNLLAHKTREKKIELLVDYSPELPFHYIADPTRIRQILTNLIGNAIKFTEKGYIMVKVTGKGQGGENSILRFEVIDTGIGIPKELQGKLFQSFQQADVTTTRKFGGTGLGLAICRKLTRIMGGEIGVESVEGEGATFWFELPLPLAENANNETLSISEDLNQAQVIVVSANPMEKEIILKYTKSWNIKSTTSDSLEKALSGLQQQVPTGEKYKNIVFVDKQLNEGYTPSPDDATEIVYLIPEDYPHGDLEKNQVSFINKPLYPDELKDAIHGAVNRKKRS